MNIIKYECTDSTNTRAKEYAKMQDAKFPTVFIADEQTAGRGRMGRSFDSARGAGLYITFLFKPEEKGIDGAKITIRAAVSLAIAIEKAFGVCPKIKWINDIILNEKKLAGILTEGAVDSNGNFEYAVCGMGINLLSRIFPDEIRDIVTTVEDATGTRPNKEIFEKLLIDEFFTSRDDSEIIREYRKRSSVIGKNVKVNRISGEFFFAKAIDVTDSGALTVETEDGNREDLISAEVSIRIK